MKFSWRRKWLKVIFASLLLFPLSIGAFIVFVFRPYSFGDPPQIPRGWGATGTVPFKGTPANPAPISAPEPSQHPFLAKTNSSNMHVDALASDVHPIGGPLGKGPRVQSLANGSFGGQCASVTFDSRGNIVAVCANFQEFSLLLISPENLSPLARMSLPPRQSNKSLNLRKIVSDTSGGAYFFLDHKDRAVLVDGNQTLKIIGQRWEQGKPRFEVEKEYSLLQFLQKNSGLDDVVTSVLPDWQGRYWLVSRRGLIAVFNPQNEKISFIRLDREEIQNSFALDERSVYVVSDRALYSIRTPSDSDQPIVVWREEYERATQMKPGTISLGSGTTPTLLGDKFVAIADNAQPQVNVLLYHRHVEGSESRLVCKVPVFQPGKSATENTLIGVGNSLIVENNYGYDLFTNMMFGRTGKGGIARIDIKDNKCEVKWQNPIISQTTVPKLSLETGLIYVYTKDPSIGWGVDAYYLSALDFDTGETVFEVLTGTGVSYDNNWSPITLGPNQCAYVGVLRGLVQICDGRK